MVQAFPNDLTFSEFNAPTRIEADIYDLEVVQGEVPKGLNGVFYRVQPDPQWPPKMGWDIPLNGDGMITMFAFRDGRVDFKSRYVRTEKFEAERTARKALFGTYRNPFTDDPSVKGLSRGTANTHVLWHHRKLYALKEDSHPVELDPFTLETRGSSDFGGGITGLTYTAHPKIDPVSGELVGYGYAARGEATPEIACYTVDSSGQVTSEQWLDAPYTCMIHDFGLTAEHMLIPITPLCSDIERIKQGGPHYEWDGTRPSHLGVVPRAGGAVRWFDGPTCHATHTLNAFAEGRKLHYDTPTGGMMVFPYFPVAHNDTWTPARSAPRLTRWTVDLDDNDGRIVQTPLTTTVGDFPRMDDRFASRNYRYGWIMGLDEAFLDPSDPPQRGGMITNAIIQHDVVTGEKKSFFVGRDSSAQEPQFVPRSPDAPEADGWLVMVVHRLGEMRSDLVVLDTTDISAGPVATVKLPIRLRRGLHGTWVPAEDLDSL